MTTSQLELTIARLNVLLRPCVRHNNPSHLEVNEERVVAHEKDNHIVCDKCDCSIDMGDYESWEEAVEAWNDRPYVDGLIVDYIAEINTARELEVNFHDLTMRVKMICEMVVGIKKNNRVDMGHLNEAYWTSTKILNAIGLYEQERKEMEEQYE